MKCRWDEEADREVKEPAGDGGERMPVEGQAFGRCSNS